MFQINHIPLLHFLNAVNANQSVCIPPPRHPPYPLFINH